MEYSQLFWQCDFSDFKAGLTRDPDSGDFVCLACGATFQPGRVYQEGDAWFDAKAMAARHVEAAHGGMFAHLCGLDRRLSGMTERQLELAALFRSGVQDAEIARRLGGLSVSTVRNHRFALREKARQARVFLAIQELAEAARPSCDAFVPAHGGGTAVDERYAITQAESQAILAKFMPSGRLERFPAKEKQKLPILRRLASLFQPGRRYTEKEVNAILGDVFADYATLRRYLIEYGFMEREPDCSAYWLKG
jgi:DNA-binding CsgD family transcriptional regulator